MKKIEDTKLHFFDIYILVYLFVLFSGDTRSAYLYVTMGLYALLLFLILQQIKFRIIAGKDFVIIVFLAIYIFVMGLPASGIEYSLKRSGAFLLQTSPILILYYYKCVNQPSKKKLKTILTLTFLIILFFTLVSFYAYTRMGINARKMASKDIDYGNIAIGGGYYFAFALTLYSVYLLDIAKNNMLEDKVGKISAIIFSIWSGFVIYETLSTITFIAYILGIFIVCVTPNGLRKRKGVENSILQLVIIAVTILLLSFTIKSIGEWILKISSDNMTTIGLRLRSFAYMLLGNDTGGAYSEGRMSLPLVSLNTFIHNPIFGVAYKHGNGFFRPYLFGVANHCEWADTLADYGLVGGVPLLYLYFSRIIKIYHNRALSFGLAVAFFILGMFNPFRCFQTSIVLFCLIPLIELYISE